MTTTYTPSLRLTLQADGANPTTWGDVENTQVTELIEAGLCGVAQVTITGSADIDISATTQNGAPDTARNMVLQLVGTLGANINLIVPAVSKVYLIDGLWSGAYTVTIKTVGGGSGVVLTAPLKVVVYTSGTTITQVAESLPIGALLAANNLSDLTNVATARTNLGLGTMATQDANAVAITGGTISGVTGLSAVTSVAGRTGDVVLSASDISGLGALATATSVITAAAAGKLVLGAVTIQWGASTSNDSGSGHAVTFGTAFSGTPYYVSFTTIASAQTAFTTGERPAFATNTWTTTGFHALGDDGTQNMAWIAIGPT